MTGKPNWTINLQNKGNGSLSENPTWQSRGEKRPGEAEAKEMYVAGCGGEKTFHSMEKSEKHLLWDTEVDREVVINLQDKMISCLHNQFSD